MHHNSAPAILVVGRRQVARAGVTQILDNAGYYPIECDATATELASTAADNDYSLIISVDVPQREGRNLLRLPAKDGESGMIPVLYLSCLMSREAMVEEHVDELLANIRALLRVRQAEERVRLRLHDMTHLHEITTRLSKTMDLQPTLELVLNAVLELQQAPMGSLFLLNEERGVLIPAATVGLSSKLMDSLVNLPVGAGASGRAVSERRAIVIEDVETDPRYQPYLHLAHTGGYQSAFSVPLLTIHEEPLGTLSTYWREPHRPSDWEIHLVELYAVHAAAAIENARLLRQLRDQDRNKDEFLAMLAHELRNPLAPIMNSAQVLRLHAPANDTLLWAISMVERQTRHLTRIVDDLLDVSRITRGKIELHRELVTVHTVLQNAAESARPIMTDRSHELTLELPDQTLWLDADPVRLEQILSNLLQNAAKYTPRGGHISMRAEREGPRDGFANGAVVIRVRDNGIGISPDMLRRVFDVFSQAERTLDRAEGGLGLGLTLVRRMTEMHGGTIEARSEGLGRGSEFILRLPLVPLPMDTFEGQNREIPETGAIERSGQAHGRRVLVIDDQVDTAQSLAELLEIWGHDVRVGYDGPSAVELTEQYGPEVVLLDIGLPLMNGYEVARRLRQTYGHDLLIIAMTGYGQEEDRQRAMEAGFDLHMTKPVDLAVLRDLIGTATAI